MFLVVLIASLVFIGGAFYGFFLVGGWPFAIYAVIGYIIASAKRNSNQMEKPAIMIHNPPLGFFLVMLLWPLFLIFK
jgi:hypothetical protein